MTCDGRPDPGIDMFDLKSYLETEKKRIDAEILGYIQKLCPSPTLREPIEYAVTAGGKRLRPVLCLSAAHAVGGNADDAMPAACAIEMIHTYSLIHDDLPALDDDALRRGKPTCHIQYGEATAILSGDALLNMAFELMSEYGLQAPNDQVGRWMQVIRTVGHASGCHGMIEGQVRDLIYEGVKLERSELETLHCMKTGALIQAAVQCGGILASASPSQLENLGKYATKIGLAFQVVDDILNLTGDPKIMGKATGTDQEREKNTYPSLIGLEASREYAAELVQDALQALTIFDKKADCLRAIAAYVVERNR